MKISPKTLLPLASSSPSPYTILVSHFSTSASSFSSRRHDEESRNVRVSVWWDFENCNVPAGVNIYKVSQAITAAVRDCGIKGPVTITAFGDVFQLSRAKQEALSVTGINITHVPNGGKNSADRSLLIDLMSWVSHNPPPAHLFLISGDRDFASILHRLRMNNYNILLASPDTAPDVLCSAASIMWPWNSLVRGEHITAKHFNQPPDGPYGSWYGHYKGPLADPFSVAEQPALSRTNGASEPAPRPVPKQPAISRINEDSELVLRPVPKSVVKQIRLILDMYPKGISITDLRSELSKYCANMDKDLYGYKKFSRFLLSMPQIMKLTPERDGQYLVHGATPKASEPFESGLGIYNGHVCKNGGQDLSKSLKFNGGESCKDGAADGKSALPLSHEAIVEDPPRKVQQTPILSDNIVNMDVQEPPKSVEQPPPSDKKVVEPVTAQETDGHQPPVVEQDSAPVVGFFRKFWPRRFGGNNGDCEIKSQNSPEKCSKSADISEKITHSTREKSCTYGDSFEKTIEEKSKKSPSQDADPVSSSSSSNESAKESKTVKSAEACKKSTKSPGFFNRMVNWCKFWSSNPDSDTLQSSERPNQIKIASQKHRVLYEDSFWCDMASFIDSPKGSVVVSQSRTREEMAQSLQKEGPLALRDLSNNDLLNLVEMLISEKKWVKECPSQISPFKLTRPDGNKPLDNSCAANGLRSIFLTTPSRPYLHDGEKKSKNMTHAGVSAPVINKLHPERSRCDILVDCQKLVSEILKEHPEGYNMGGFRKLFLERYGYHLDIQKLGYQKLVSLLEIMPGVQIESSYIVPSSNLPGGSVTETSFLNIEEDNASNNPLFDSDSALSETSKKSEDSGAPWNLKELGPIVQSTEKSTVNYNSALSETSKKSDDFDELGPVSNMSFDKNEVQSVKRSTATEETKRRTFEPVSLSDDGFSDSDSDSEEETSSTRQAEEHGKAGINEEDNSLLQILDSWYSKDGEKRKEKLDNVDGPVGCSNNGAKPSVLAELASKSENSMGKIGRKQRPQKNYCFVTDPGENNKDKLIDGILGSLKKSSDSRMQS